MVSWLTSQMAPIDAVVGILAWKTAPAVAQRNALRAAIQYDLKVLNPAWGSAYIARNHGYLICGGLLSRDATHRAYRRTAESWRARDDGRTATVALPRAPLHDGKSVSEDYIASHNRSKAPKPYPSSIGRVVLAHGGA